MTKPVSLPSTPKEPSWTLLSSTPMNTREGSGADESSCSSSFLLLQLVSAAPARFCCSSTRIAVPEPHPELCPTCCPGTSWALPVQLCWGLMGQQHHAPQQTEMGILWRFYLAKSIPCTAKLPVQFSRRSPALGFPSWGSAESNMKMMQGRDNTAQSLAKPLQLLTQNISDFWAVQEAAVKLVVYSWPSYKCRQTITSSFQEFIQSSPVLKALQNNLKYQEFWAPSEPSQCLDTCQRLRGCKFK